MTAPTAPGGLKLTEEQVDAIDYVCSINGGIGCENTGDLTADWRTLSAACDAKDAEIARKDALIAELRANDARIASVATRRIRHGAASS